jgi:hypothetical protein
MTVQWGVPNPANVSGSILERRRAFRDGFLVLRHRIELFAALPFDKLTNLALRERLAAIGRRRHRAGDWSTQDARGRRGINPKCRAAAVPDRQ